MSLTIVFLELELFYMRVNYMGEPLYFRFDNGIRHKKVGRIFGKIFGKTRPSASVSVRIKGKIPWNY